MDKLTPYLFFTTFTPPLKIEWQGKQKPKHSILIKRLLISSLLIVGFMAMSFAGSAQNKSYISKYKAVAAVLAKSYGIPSSLILAVAAIESSGGKGPAARILNNHFGIEGHNEFVNKKGHSSRYKQYPNAFASYLDFCQLLTRKRFYQKLKNNPDCTAWVKAMSKAHYSEVPEEWEQKIFGMLATIKGSGKFKASESIASTK